MPSIRGIIPPFYSVGLLALQSSQDMLLKGMHHFADFFSLKPQIPKILEYNRIQGKIHSLKNISVTIEFIPNCFGELPIIEEVKAKPVEETEEAPKKSLPKRMKKASEENEAEAPAIEENTAQENSPVEETEEK